MNQTNWKFGQQNINVLAVTVVYHRVAFPLLFKMLPKFGNSNTTINNNLTFGQCAPFLSDGEIALIGKVRLGLN
jgi:hypothetical protein